LENVPAESEYAPEDTTLAADCGLAAAIELGAATEL
jgi:hypothetical protein